MLRQAVRSLDSVLEEAVSSVVPGGGEARMLVNLPLVLGSIPWISPGERRMARYLGRRSICSERIVALSFFL